MALEMHLEMSGGPQDWKVLNAILSEIGLSDLSAQDETGMRAALGNGELLIGVSWGNPKRDGVIRAEGKHECHFKVTGTILFRINNSMYNEAVATIKSVLTSLTERTDMQFVLSFQFEEVRAIRDEQRGFEWFWNEPR
ncbi:MAG: hypothetical protein EOP24_34970 [Hyphomicrobiales bacterium]|nr:MAG: hypothetical protein EOP24_34970 [Hyphomicrobiales bacterium]